MTNTAATAATSRPSWLAHPILAWRAHRAALAERADAQAVAAGLTVEVLPNEVRRYRHAHLDEALTTYHARHTAPDQADAAAAGPVSSAWSTPTLTAAGALVDQWGERICSASYRLHAADLPEPPARGVGPATPATSMPDRLRRAELYAGAGAIPDPPLPHQAGCATSFPNGSADKHSAGKHVAVRLDPGDPAGPVPGAPRAGAQPAPARLSSGPATTAGGAR